jgi:hypothetical protein
MWNFSAVLNIAKIKSSNFVNNIVLYVWCAIKNIIMINVLAVDK